MPDAGNIDLSTTGPRHPADWASAFAALPLEAPDANGWQRVRNRLPADVPSTRMRWPAWLAVAASLALAVAIPLHMQPGDAPITAAHHTPPSGSSSPTAPAAHREAIASVGPAGSALPDSPGPAVVPPPDVQQAARPATPSRRMTPASQRPLRTLAKPAADARLAATNPGEDLEQLYAQSARLEELLALARDDRVTTGTASALVDELDARVASIDAALVDPALHGERRLELWGERIDTLRDLVGVEATQRLLASRGQPYEAALVSID